MFLPKEIMINIYEYDPIHREHFKKSLLLIPREAIEKRLNYMINQYHYYNCQIPFENIVITNISDPDHFVNILKQCKCCARHQINKPSSLNDYPQQYDIDHIPSNQNTCLCSCRHHSRWIVRSFNSI